MIEQMTTTSLRSIRLSTGVTLPYAVRGEPWGIPMILLHGFADSWHSYERVLRHLPSWIRTYAISQRGHGDASKPDGGYKPEDFAADLVAFLDAHRIESAIIAGHSMGATVAERFAIDYPERTRGLVLISGIKNWSEHQTFVEFNDNVLTSLTDPVDPAFVREFQLGALARPVLDPFMITIILESMKVPAHVWQAVGTAFLASDLAADAHRIIAPTLLLRGEQDGITSRADLEWLAATIPGARVVTYEEAGHAPHWEIPARFAADLLQFIEDVTG